MCSSLCQASKSDDGKHKVEANPNQGEEMGYIFTTESQEGGDSEGEVVTGAHEDNNSLTSDTNLESLSTDDKRGKVCILQSLCTLQLNLFLIPM